MKSLWRNSPTKNFTILFRKQCKYKTSSEVIILNLEDGCLANKWNKGITDFGHKSSANAYLYVAFVATLFGGL